MGNPEKMCPEFFFESGIVVLFSSGLLIADSKVVGLVH